MTNAPVKFEVDTSNSSGGDGFTRKYSFDLDLGVTQNFVQYPLHYVTYPHTKFEVGLFNSFRGDAFTRNTRGDQKVRGK